MTSSPVRKGIETMIELVRRAAATVAQIAAGAEPAAAPARGAGRFDDPYRETSTNAQMQGAADEPWSGNR